MPPSRHSRLSSVQLDMDVELAIGMKKLTGDFEEEEIGIPGDTQCIFMISVRVWFNGRTEA